MSMRFPGGLIATSPVNARYPSGVWTQAQTAPYQAQNVWTRDRFWPNTTLLLQGDGAVNGAQNNTFLDSSSNNFTITRNGNTTQGAFTPYEQDGYWSNFFDGSGDYLSIPDNAALDIPNDFTIEFWINVGAGNVDRAGIIGHRDQSTFTDGTDWVIRVETSAGKIGFGYDSSGNYYDMGSYVVGEWAHYAITRSGTTIRTFKNGTQVATATSSSTWSSGSPFLIGRNVPSFDFSGYVSNVRLVKGTAVYTSSFTPSAAPLTAITNTSLLTCQSNRFKDNSTNNFAITRNGDTSVQAFQPFPGATTWSASVLGGSGYFDGSGDWLSVASNNNIPKANEAFTVESWVRINTTNQVDLFAWGEQTSSKYTAATFNFGGTGNILFFWWSNDLQVTGTNVSDGAWHHVAFTYDGTTRAIYLDGVRVASDTPAAHNVTVTNNLTIGYRPSGTAYPFNGYMSGFRIVSNAAIYSGTTYTVPSAPPTTTVSSGTVSTLLNFTNAGIYDNSMMNNLETVGNAQVSTSVVKYGTGSMYFDGSGDYLVARGSNLFEIGSGDFTVEMWVSSSTVNALRSFVTYSQSSISSYANMSWYMLQLSDGTVAFETSNGGSSPVITLISTSSLSANTWTHVAMSRSGATYRLFINGNLQASGTSSASVYVPGGANLYVGLQPSFSRDFNGYIDDLRITKGAARYITNFTPPIARLPAQ